MGFNCGIVGLPNVGKSTLFNALTATQAAEAANFPFCTKEPNVGRVGVPDPRLERLAAIAKSQKIIPTQLEFVDIAGLIRGASKGEGLGNQFLGNIREVDAIIHVLRCFVDDDVTHVEGGVDPLRDAEVVETELMLADMESLERQLTNLQKKAKGGDKDAKVRAELMERALKVLQDGKPARVVPVSAEEEPLFRQFMLLTAKPVLYVCNVEEASAATGNRFSELVAAKAAAEGAACVVISAAIEAEVAQLTDPAEKTEFLESMGLEETGLNKLIRAGYGLLGLITFFTVGPKEARAWTLTKGSTAPQAAGVIHTDFERGFIRAETIDYDSYVTLGGEQGAKDAGKMRQEGKEYVVHDGDIFHFRFNV
ncbi:redox-regulated ATPase YchF [Azospirillum halopraeferens]|uniref:redox-regulated ATPase YchF n=1 Tax=Azospirillum halopraeferens TaxID=34010 RepID=UPI00041E5203|nr:redox-regulated ATPase YchF [Azospirillum halopraeferens]